mmetsp:Transcript_32477/g.69154  ORF Transcript_32477/g.69154 Transcript_32477/m.69154 type:complete len:201 (+) Transcript_32477:187-789(+)
MDLDALRLQLFVVGVRHFQLFVCRVKVLLQLLLLELRLILLEAELKLGFVLRVEVFLRLAHEGLILLCGLILAHLCLRLDAHKVALDHLEHTHHATFFALHPLVGAHLRCLLPHGDLDKLALARIESLEDRDGLLDRLLRLCRILDRSQVGFLLLATSGRGLRHRLPQGYLLRSQARDLVCHACDGHGFLLDLRMQPGRC